MASAGAVRFDVLCIKEFSNAAAGSVKSSAGADIKCDVRVPFKYNGTTYYLPAYDTTV
jgi:hypothetical protein